VKKKEGKQRKKKEDGKLSPPYFNSRSAPGGADGGKRDTAFLTSSNVTRGLVIE